MLVYGPSKVGKTWLGDTTPGPRLILDYGGETKFTKSKKIEWDPAIDPPPEANDSWDTCVVKMRDFSIIDLTYQWLNSGQHPFESVVLDQLSEIQRMIIRHYFGTSPMRTQDWGELLREGDDIIRKYRDLCEHQVKPLKAVVFIAGAKLYDEKYRPFLSGQLRDNLPYSVDLVGYFYTDFVGDELVRRMLIQDTPRFVAGTRIHPLVEKYGTIIDNPNIEEMIKSLSEGE